MILCRDVGSASDNALQSVPLFSISWYKAYYLSSSSSSSLKYYYYYYIVIYPFSISLARSPLPLRSEQNTEQIIPLQYILLIDIL